METNIYQNLRDELITEISEREKQLTYLENQMRKVKARLKTCRKSLNKMDELQTRWLEVHGE